MDRELTRTSRLSAMLIAAAVVVPGVALAGMLVLRHYILVRYDTHTLTLWLVFDAVVLAAGLILRENATVPRQPAKRRSNQRSTRKGRRH